MVEDRALRSRTRTAIAVEVLVWWCVAVGVWMLSLSAFSGQDLLVAVSCGLPCGVMAVVARRAVRGSWKPPRAAVRALAVLPWAIVVDTVRVLRLPWIPSMRSTVGEFRESTPVTGIRTATAGRQAFAAVLISSAPGTYVVDMDGQHGSVLHDVTDPSRVERKLYR